jgi:mRNA-degrading endonuclease RelE of RelBE toxin-antitoxin system
MDLPKYPQDYFDFSNGYNIADDQINEWIKEMVEELDDNPECYGLGKSTGNTYVRVDRDDVAKYRVFVTKNYQEKSIF